VKNGGDAINVIKIKNPPTK